MSIFTPFNIDDCSLQNQRIDIWQYPLRSEFSEGRALLSNDELARADRYHFPRHRRRFTIARATLRLILSRYLNISAKQLEFNYNPHGKPELVNLPALKFNLSHSRDSALLAIGYEFPLGIDLEFFSARPYEGIGSHIFSNNENNILKHLPKHLHPLGFFHLWAQKEALIKACGLGLSYPTKRFDLPLLPTTNQQIIDPQQQKTWHIKSFMPAIACCAAICHHPSIQEIRFTSNVELGKI